MAPKTRHFSCQCFRPFYPGEMNGVSFPDGNAKAESMVAVPMKSGLELPSVSCDFSRVNMASGKSKRCCPPVASLLSNTVNAPCDGCMEEMSERRAGSRIDDERSTCRDTSRGPPRKACQLD
jgi:hypothetical protein